MCFLPPPARARVLCACTRLNVSRQGQGLVHEVGHPGLASRKGADEGAVQAPRTWPDLNVAGACLGVVRERMCVRACTHRCAACWGCLTAAPQISVSRKQPQIDGPPWAIDGKTTVLGNQQQVGLKEGWRLMAYAACIFFCLVACLEGVQSLSLCFCRSWCKCIPSCSFVGFEHC